MPKVKTHKGISKRFKVTKNGKVLKRRDGQDHFNARQTGKRKRNKRSDSNMTNTGITKTIIRSVKNKPKKRSSRATASAVAKKAVN